jgi:hypothetical protein
VSKLLRVCLVLKIVLMLYQYPLHLNLSETPFTYGIYRAQKLFLFIWTTATIGINARVNDTLWITYL